MPTMQWDEKKVIAVEKEIVLLREGERLINLPQLLPTAPNTKVSFSFLMTHFSLLPPPTTRLSAPDQCSEQVSTEFLSLLSWILKL